MTKGTTQYKTTAWGNLHGILSSISDGIYRFSMVFERWADWIYDNKQRLKLRKVK